MSHLVAADALPSSASEQSDASNSFGTVETFIIKDLLQLIRIIYIRFIDITHV